MHFFLSVIIEEGKRQFKLEALELTPLSFFLQLAVISSHLHKSMHLPKCALMKWTAVISSSLADSYSDHILSQLSLSAVHDTVSD